MVSSLRTLQSFVFLVLKRAFFLSFASLAARVISYPGRSLTAPAACRIITFFSSKMKATFKEQNGLNNCKNVYNSINMVAVSNTGAFSSFHLSGVGFGSERLAVRRRSTLLGSQYI